MAFQLFSENILKNKNNRELVNIFSQGQIFFIKKNNMKKVLRILFMQII